MTPPQAPQVHSHPCTHCPSEWHERDPEAQDMLDACVSGKLTESEFLFKCAWRNEKICRGLWNRLQEAKQ